MVGKTGVGVRGWSQGLGKGVEPKGWWSQSGSQSGTIVGFRIEWLIPVALDALLELEVVALAVKVLHLEQKKRRKKKRTMSMSFHCSGSMNYNGSASWVRFFSLTHSVVELNLRQRPCEPRWK